MHLLGLEIDLLLHESYSLKDKRQIVQSIIKRLQGRYHLTACQLDQEDLHNYARIGVGIVSNAHSLAVSQLQKAIDMVEGHYPVDISQVIWIE